MENTLSHCEGTLILVCCHAIYYPLSKDLSRDGRSPFDERSWLLAPFQRSRGELGSSNYKEGEHLTFLRHVLTSVWHLLSRLGFDTDVSAGEEKLSEEARGGQQLFMQSLRSCRRTRSKGEPAHVVLSGGATKRSEGCNETEARSYLEAFRAALNLVSHSDDIPQDLQSRIDTINSFIDASPDSSTFNSNIHCEELATDSFQNILFSLLVFRRVAGTWPQELLVVTHSFKTQRVRDCHLTAIRWPVDRCQVIGIDPPFSSVKEEEEVREGEHRRGYMAWSQDLYGSRTNGVLGKKRQERGWDEAKSLRKVETLLDGLSEKENVVLRRLLTWAGGETGTELFPYKLPWEDGG